MICGPTGHGALGHHVSEFCKNDLHKVIAAQGKLLETQPHKALEQAFVQSHKRLEASGIDCQFSGTTVILVYISGNKIYSCNAGDSRAVLAKQRANSNHLEAVPLSSDHKPDVDSERARILAAGGRVESCKGNQGEDIGPARVWLLKHDVPGLAMTRSFGDLIAQSVGVSHKPEIWERTIVPEEDKFIVIGSDGIYEFIENQEVVNIAAKAKSAEEACKLLVEEATHKWHMEEEVVDDCSCIVIYL